MKQVRVNGFGAVSNLLLIDAPESVARGGEVLIEIKASSVSDGRASDVFPLLKLNAGWSF